MGVSELFHFRRYLRRGRRVADGSRHFVIGLDRTSSDANKSSSTSSPGMLPKGSHFMVAYNRHAQLSEEEMDVCNNNTNVDALRTHPRQRNYVGGGGDNQRRTIVDAPLSLTTSSELSSNNRIVGCSSNRDYVISTVMPGTSSSFSQGEGSTIAAVISTEELREIKFFTSK